MNNSSWQANKHALSLEVEVKKQLRNINLKQSDSNEKKNTLNKYDNNRYEPPRFKKYFRYY